MYDWLTKQDKNMKAVRVQYTVKTEYVKQNKANIQLVMDDLHQNPIEGMNYSSYYLGEGAFMHVNISKDSETMSKLNERKSFIEFRMALKNSQPTALPKSEDLELVGSNNNLNKPALSIRPRSE